MLRTGYRHKVRGVDAQLSFAGMVQMVASRHRAAGEHIGRNVRADSTVAIAAFPCERIAPAISTAAP